MKKEYTVQNPSDRLLASPSVHVIGRGYEQTCCSETCSCATHDPGYDWATIEVEESFFDQQIHWYSSTKRSFGTTCLHEEYVESHTAKGLPSNAPAWAYTLNTSYERSGICFGEYVEVKDNEEFTVVRLLQARNTRSFCGWSEQEIFATRDGVGDHTKEYRTMCFLRMRTAYVAEFEAAGLTPEESSRLFKIGKEPWTREQTPLLFKLAHILRTKKDGLYKLAIEHSCREQSRVISENRLEIPALSSPRTSAFAAKALWVFHGAKVTDQRSNPAPVAASPGLVSLAGLFD